MTEQIEQRAQDIWQRRLFHHDIHKIAHKYGFTANEIRWLEWDALPKQFRITFAR